MVENGRRKDQQRGSVAPLATQKGGTMSGRQMGLYLLGRAKRPQPPEVEAEPGSNRLIWWLLAGYGLLWAGLLHCIAERFGGWWRILFFVSSPVGVAVSAALIGWLMRAVRGKSDNG
jgi:hypothetical protein